MECKSLKTWTVEYSADWVPDNLGNHSRPVQHRARPSKDFVGGIRIIQHRRFLQNNHRADSPSSQPWHGNYDGCRYWYILRSSGSLMSEARFCITAGYHE